jgi:hypothetical protein
MFMPTEQRDLSNIGWCMLGNIPSEWAEFRKMQRESEVKKQVSRGTSVAKNNAG